MKIVKTKNALKEAIRAERALGKRIALVPTMGALHAGHISLVDAAKQHADSIIASIFVNPTQFGPNEDFAKYPRTEEEDVHKLEEAGAQIVYMPIVEEMYPEGAITIVHVQGISKELCGAFRPGHFDGVATIVTKLFMQAQPDVALFGEKDYQQLHIIKQFTRDLDMMVRIIGVPILREADGLAMSSRNRYLSDSERKKAASLFRVLTEAKEKILQGEASMGVIAEAKQQLLSSGFTKIDYVELRDAASLAPVHEITKPARLLTAAHLGTTRLIDNVEVIP